MKKTSVSHLILLVLAVLALASVAAGGGRTFTMELTGAQEAPTPGDPDGSGTAVITINPGLGTVCWELSVTGITLPASGSHIHIAPTGMPGPIVVHLSAPDANGYASGCHEDVSRELLIDIMANPAGYYVNVHNSDYPLGALRGQLSQ